MKKLLLIAAVAFIATRCNNETASTDTKASPDSSTAKYDYAYLPENHPPDNWEAGSQENVVLALKTLKAFENKDIEGALAGFADSVRWSADLMDKKLSKDSLRAMFNQAYTELASVKVKMSDYEAVISKDKKHEWVTLWYTQINTDKKGKVDSMAYVDDLKIENGKITVLDEKGRRFPAK
jgi:hypothetical protein